MSTGCIVVVAGAGAAGPVTRVGVGALLPLWLPGDPRHEERRGEA